VKDGSVTNVRKRIREYENTKKQMMNRHFPQIPLAYRSGESHEELGVVGGERQQNNLRRDGGVGR
jgi:hypothetical protein